MDILGVRIDNLKKAVILDKISSFLTKKKFHQIVTVNPEFVLLAQENKDFQEIINASDLNIADGMGISLAFLLTGRRLKKRYAGIDLTWDILEIASREELGIFLATRKDGLSTWEETRDAIHMRFPTLQITGIDIDPKSSALPKIEADIIFCNFGAPEQEKFINSIKNDTIKLAVGVGGSFDFISGKVKRAPKLMRKMGLEWLWRLILEPRYRFKRIFRAVVLFPIKVLFNKK